MTADRMQVQSYFTCIRQGDIYDRQVNEIDGWSQPLNHIIPEFKLSFFNKNEPVYAIPRIPCGLQSTHDIALSLVRKESIELSKYMR